MGKAEGLCFHRFKASSCMAAFTGQQRHSDKASSCTFSVCKLVGSLFFFVSDER